MVQASSFVQVQQEAFRAHKDLPLAFEGSLVVVGGGQVDHDALTQFASLGLPIIAADGGADICLALGVTPLAVIGDMDSVVDLDKFDGSAKLYELTEQLTTDFEKCLYATKSQQVIALGMTGNRFDHSLGALEAAVRYAQGRPIIFVDEHDAFAAVSGRHVLDLPPDVRISVFPMQSVRFAHSQGLAYPLDGLKLEIGTRSGTSNVSTGESVILQPEDGENGVYLITVDRAYLDALTLGLNGS